MGFLVGVLSRVGEPPFRRFRTYSNERSAARATAVLALELGLNPKNSALMIENGAVISY